MTARKSKTPLDGQAAIEHGWRTTNTTLAESVRAIAVHAGSDALVTEFFRHHERYVVEGMRVTVERCEEVIAVMQGLIHELKHGPCPRCGQRPQGGSAE